MVSISKIINCGLCLGCGLCEAIDRDCRMLISKDGFYLPAPVPSDGEAVSAITHVCPGIFVDAQARKNTDVWGNVEVVCNAWSSEPDIRRNQSSGGAISTLAIYLLESHKVDGVLHVRNIKGDYLHNKLHVSRNKQEVLSGSASRYAPANVFSKIFDLLNAYKGEKFCFIGKPCDVAAMRNILREYPQYSQQIIYCLSIFCAGMPSYNATQKTIATFGNTDKKPVSVKYRGDGWPGYFSVRYSDGTEDRMTYNESWGKILGRDLKYRCKICPDGIGLLADISAGDSWNTKDGYPDFTESEGKDFLFVRNKKGSQLLNEAHKAGYLCTEDLVVNRVKEMQQYQYNRRLLVGWRILAVKMLTSGTLNFKGLGLSKISMRVGVVRGLREFTGTVKRFRTLKKEWVVQRK